MDEIREAFRKVKTDMNFLNEEITFLKQNMAQIKEYLDEIYSFMKSLTSTHNVKNPALFQNSSTHNTYFKGLKGQNYNISTGNGGVSTDRQTDRQTDNQAQNNENSIENALEILDSLDNLKKEIRLKFKQLTEQELLVFSAIYQLEEETGYCDYKTLSQHLNLTESSVRDYVSRLIKKGISVIKNKINNKTIQLSISSSLKKVATLSTILKLREL